MSHKQPHLGCTLSLTSKANIRYEGVLKGIDTDKCTLTLNNVQSFGTEDRSAKVIPPMQDVYDLIIFNGHDIQDVQVVERENDSPAMDPAIMKAEKRRSGDGKNIVTEKFGDKNYGGGHQERSSDRHQDRHSERNNDRNAVRNQDRNQDRSQRKEYNKPQDSRNDYEKSQSGPRGVAGQHAAKSQTQTSVQTTAKTAFSKPEKSAWVKKTSEKRRNSRNPSDESQPIPVSSKPVQNAPKHAKSEKNKQEI